MDEKEFFHKILAMMLVIAVLASLTCRSSLNRVPVRAVMMANAQPSPLQPSSLRRGLAAAASSPFITHGAPLPLLTRKLISPRAVTIFTFMLEYLVAEGLDADVLASGGYVRDLLLGRISNDLDLSLCLARCAPHVSIETVVQGMPDFALRRPDLGVDSVEPVSAMSDAARDKGLSAAQVRLIFGGESCSVDLMPTIGEESYDGVDRIPVRDDRGGVEADALRRDLTIGAMLLHVRAAPGPTRRSPFAVDSAPHPKLEYILLDFYGGIEDVSSRVIRTPFPRDKPLSQVWREVIRSDQDAALAAQLGIRADADPGSDDELAQLQVLWAVKSLRDDPLRLLRAIRLGAVLGFRLHSSLWRAARFATEVSTDVSPTDESPIEACPAGTRSPAQTASSAEEPDVVPQTPPRQALLLRSRVPPSRKLAELRKLGKSWTGVIAFFSLAFRGEDGLGSVTGFGSDGEAFGTLFYESLFAGRVRASGGQRPTLDTRAFDVTRAQVAIATLPTGLDTDVTLGAVLAAVVLSCEVRRKMIEDGKLGVEEERTEEMGDGEGQAEAQEAGVAPMLPAAAVVESALLEVEQGCAALDAPAPMRAAAEGPLRTALRLLAPLETRQKHVLLASAARPPDSVCDRSVFTPLALTPWGPEPSPAQLAAGLGRERAEGTRPIEEKAADFASYVRLWELAKLDPSLAQRRSAVGARFAFSLLAAAGEVELAQRCEAQLRVLSSAAEPTLSGKAVAALPGVPARWRGQFLADVHVLCRLRGDTPRLETGEDLKRYLDEGCGLQPNQLYSSTG